MSKKVTPWFPPEAKPTRKGVYECKTAIFNNGGWFRRWDGKRWHVGYSDKSLAATVGYSPLIEFIDQWRGLVIGELVKRPGRV
jgi:hypothetical protein